MPVIRGLGNVAPHVQAAAEEIARTFDLWNIGGRASSGHINNSDHYTGLAIDVMTSNKGDAVAAYAIANAARLGVKYVIWNRRIWQNGKWSAYSGSSPHTDHVHISFNAQPGTGGQPVTSGITDALGSNDGCLGRFLQARNATSLITVFTWSVLKWSGPVLIVLGLG